MPTRQVVTTSWGECEQDLRRTSPHGEHPARQDGDAGSDVRGGVRDTAPRTATARRRPGAVLDDPGSQPYAVSAGGTELLSTSGPTGETVWNSADGGGGGSSIIWPRSSFQPALAAGREVPDVSSDADPATDSYLRGRLGAGRGTSVAAPTWPRCSPSSTRANLRSAMPIRPLCDGVQPGCLHRRDLECERASDNAIFPLALGQYAANPAMTWHRAGEPEGAGPVGGLGTVILLCGPRPAQGYRMVATDGGIFAFNAPFYGSTGGQHLNAPIVGTAPDTATGGYWLVASDGGVFAFNAPSTVRWATAPEQAHRRHGSRARRRGYWLVASDGGIFAFGTAPFEGSTGSLHLNAPIVGMAPTASGGGYWLVAADGGIFAFNAPSPVRWAAST